MKIEYFCKKACPITTCSRNSCNSAKVAGPDTEIQLVHFEGNPLYCTESNWNGNQVKTEASND